MLQHRALDINDVLGFTIALASDAPNLIGVYPNEPEWNRQEQKPESNVSEPKEPEQKPLETVRVDLYENEAYQSAAKILAVLAHPINRLDRDKFEKAICIKAVTALAKNDRRWGDRHRAMGPPLPIMRTSRVESAFKTGFRKINQLRMLAAFQAEPTYRYLDFLGGARFNRELLPPNAAATIAAASILRDEIRNKVIDADKKTIVGRVWATTKPILHVAMALQNVLWPSDVMQYHAIQLSDLIEDKSLIFSILHESDKMHRFCTNAYQDLEVKDTVVIDWR
jgi:hypothetical protein